jgi:nitrogen fixation protein
MDFVLVDIEDGVVQIRNEDLVSGVLLVGDYVELAFDNFGRKSIYIPTQTEDEVL